MTDESELLIRAHNLRVNATDSERRFIQLLKQYSHCEFKFQGVIVPYIVDFVCHTHKQIIEVDGEYHFSNNQIEYDGRRTRWLNSRGYRVTRILNKHIWNKDLGLNYIGVHARIPKSCRRVIIKKQKSDASVGGVMRCDVCKKISEGYNQLRGKLLCDSCLDKYSSVWPS